jgi:protein-S-isoprenylcysteine O-methyltransferase Ste14
MESTAGHAGQAAKWRASAVAGWWAWWERLEDVGRRRSVVTSGAWSVFVQFVRAGGTPMPGAMPSTLVVTGFNRYVRNPIHLGAVTVFVGEALLLWQVSLLVYALAVWVGAAAFVRWYEEPVLARRFGADYQDYRRAVPAWVPRRHPWDRLNRRHTA